MGIWDAFSDIVEAVTPWSVVEAEAPAAEEPQQVRETQFSRPRQSPPPLSPPPGMDGAARSAVDDGEVDGRMLTGTAGGNHRD